MGNTPSTSSAKQPAGHSTSQQDRDREGNQRSNEIPTKREPRRRESIHTLSSAKATALPPSASLTSATAQPASASVSPSNTRSISASSASSHTRNRSATIATATPRIRPADSRSRERSMGNDQSAPQRAPSGSRKLEKAQTLPETRPSPASNPVTIPGGPAPVDPRPVLQAQSPVGPGSPPPEVWLDPKVHPAEAFALPAASYSRPPRLPLAIEEEDHTPGSPILTPANVASPVDSNEADSDIPRRSSVISSNVDEEEEPDEFQGHMPETAANVPKIATVIEWRDAPQDERVYVTGTFTDWQRKFRLHHNGPSKHKDAVSATLQLPPGTHHVKFLVGNDMICSPHLPTTVDFTNILVNYIEVTPATTSKSTKTTAPVAVPAPEPSRPLDIRPKTSEPSAASGRPPTPRTQAQEHAASPATRAQRPTPTHTPPPKEARATASPSMAQRQPPKHYTSDIPSYLLDLDTWPPPTGSPDDSPSSAASRFRRANAAAQAQPSPPSLPLFLSKSILNGATPMKDDSSVLIMPNHTVLNHLATTNIKNGVLATSATTRYKKKVSCRPPLSAINMLIVTQFLTTIMYKPRSDDGD